MHAWPTEVTSDSISFSKAGADGLSVVLWNHDPKRLTSALGGLGRAQWWPEFDVLRVVGGALFNMAALDQRKPCTPGRIQIRTVLLDQ